MPPVMTRKSFVAIVLTLWFILAFDGTAACAAVSTT